MTSQIPVPAYKELIEELRQLYAENLEIPLENVTFDADLAADLGVDSLTQNELIALAFESYGMLDKARNIQAMSYPTIGDLADLIQQLSGQGNGGKNS